MVDRFAKDPIRIDMRFTRAERDDNIQGCISKMINAGIPLISHAGNLAVGYGDLTTCEDFDTMEYRVSYRCPYALYHMHKSAEEQSKLNIPVRFAIMGVAGYVAKKHLDAIRELGGEVVAACDPSDTVGILDSYAPNCRFYRDEHWFFLHLQSLRDSGHGVDYVVICTPNHLHAEQCIKAINMARCNIICEKPVALDDISAEYVNDVAKRAGVRVSPILQLRLNNSLAMLKSDLMNEPLRSMHGMSVLDYFTPRGHWYMRSWKSDPNLSGGLLMNIGVHMFDAMINVFGIPVSFKVNDYRWNKSSGVMYFEKNTVRWNISTNPADGNSPKRELRFNDRTPISFDDSYGHLKSYKHIINYGGFEYESCIPTIEIVNKMRDTIRVSKFGSIIGIGGFDE